MAEQQVNMTELYARGAEGLRAVGYERPFPPDAAMGTPLKVNRAYLDSLFYTPRFLSTVEADCSTTILGTPVKVPMFCGPMAGWSQLSETALEESARGLKAAGGMMTLGIGGSDDVQKAVDIGVPVAKIVKPYRDTDLIFKKLEDAERRGCVAVGMDTDHCLGRLVGDVVGLTDTFGPQTEKTMRDAIAHTKLPFIIKGVLGADDARKAVELGAKAIIVSNHGMASLEAGTPALVALPEVVGAVEQRRRREAVRRTPWC